jgi:hypothetical protein
MKNRPRLGHQDWEYLRRRARYAADEPPALFAELCRVFHASERAMACAVSHGQVSIDGYIVRMQHMGRWTEEQLAGRYAVLCGRAVQLYGSTRVDRLRPSADSSRVA